jgi:hypothetical protein
VTVKIKMVHSSRLSIGFCSVTQQHQPPPFELSNYTCLTIDYADCLILGYNFSFLFLRIMFFICDSYQCLVYILKSFIQQSGHLGGGQDDVNYMVMPVLSSEWLFSQYMWMSVSGTDVAQTQKSKCNLLKLETRFYLYSSISVSNVKGKVVWVCN